MRHSLQARGASQKITGTMFAPLLPEVGLRQNTASGLNRGNQFCATCSRLEGQKRKDNAITGRGIMKTRKGQESTYTDKKEQRENKRKDIAAAYSYSCVVLSDCIVVLLVCSHRYTNCCPLLRLPLTLVCLLCWLRCSAALRFTALLTLLACWPTCLLTLLLHAQIWLTSNINSLVLTCLMCVLVPVKKRRPNHSRVGCQQTLCVYSSL